MSGIHLALLGMSFGGGLPAIGAAYEGGFFAGQISTAGNSIADYNLVVAPLSSGKSTLDWKNATTATPGADSVIDGPQNTADMVADGNSTVYPSAHFCNNLVIGGFSDWYMPASNELDVIYFNLKPGTQSNNVSGGINPNAVPARASNYTSGSPAQTSAAAFQTGGAEAFTAFRNRSSTEYSATAAITQSFADGLQYGQSKILTQDVRGVRRVAV